MAIDWNIITTVLGALIWFLLGYYGRQPDENFEPKKVFKTVAAGLIVGIAVVVFGVPELEALTIVDVASRMGLIITLERLYRILTQKKAPPTR